MSVPKQALWETLLAEHLEQRGLPAGQARLLARAGVACFDEGLQRWLADPRARRPGLDVRVSEAFDELAQLVAGG